MIWGFHIILTSRYLDLEGGADQRHEGGCEVDAHVVIHRHVHQYQSLMIRNNVLFSEMI